MIIYYTTDFGDKTAILSDDQYLHCAKVLRKKINDVVYVTNGAGALFEAQVDNISKKEVVLTINKTISQQSLAHKRQIAIAPTKNIDRFEWFLEKATEIGITDIFPFLSARSERKIIKPSRLEKIIVSAMKQSKNLYKPKLHPLMPLTKLLKSTDIVDQKFVAHCMDPDAKLNKLYKSESDAIVLIGPEGDFTKVEVATAINDNWKEVSLGDSRLRTETAGLIACHILNL
ncbi:MAG: RsmE family RNA methyltransferase [Saprospiraceae bacterium]